MELVNNFLIGFIASFIGVLPPGLLNLTAAKIRVQEGVSRAYLFSVGVALVVVTQTAVGLMLAVYLNKEPEVLLQIKRIAVALFFMLSIYFLFFAKDTRIKIPKENRNSHTNRFFAGMLLAVINLFPFPYWAYIGVAFSELNWLSFSTKPFAIAIIGSGLGTYVTLTIYIKYFNQRRSTRIEKLNLNWLIGGVTGIVAVITLFELLT